MKYGTRAPILNASAKREDIPMSCFGRSNAPKVPVRPKDVSQNDRDDAAVDGLQDTNDELAAQINQQNAIMVEQKNTIAQLELSNICTLEERVRKSSEKNEVCGQLLHRIEQFEKDNKRLRDERDIMREERDQAFEDYGILIDKQDNLNEEAKQLYIHGIKRSYGQDLTTRKRSTRKESSNIDRAKMYLAKRTLHYVSDESEDDDSCDDEVGTLSHKMKSPTRNKHRNSKHASYTHRPRQMDDSVRV